jgi:hypothetical protein
MVRILKFNGIGYEEDYKFVKCRVGWARDMRAPPPPASKGFCRFS